MRSEDRTNGGGRNNRSRTERKEETAENINNQQKSTEKRSKSRKERGEQVKTTDILKYTKAKPEQDWIIKNQNEVETVRKENLGIEKQKIDQKNLDPSNTRYKEENNTEVQILNPDIEQNKETDEIICLRKHWWTAAKEVNGPNNAGRRGNSYSKRVIDHTANNHNKYIIDKESQVEV